VLFLGDNTPKKVLTGRTKTGLMKKIAEEALLQRLKREDSASFALLYDFYFPQVAAYIQQNNGSLADAEDIFQETIIALLQKVRTPGLYHPAAPVLSSSFILMYWFGKHYTISKIIKIRQQKKRQYSTALVCIHQAIPGKK
jgi:hypothetical protein